MIPRDIREPWVNTSLQDLYPGKLCYQPWGLNLAAVTVVSVIYKIISKELDRVPGR